MKRLIVLAILFASIGGPAFAAVHVEDPGVRALDFVAEHRSLFRLQDPRAELVQYEATRDLSGRHHVRFQQQSRGVPVWGGDLVVHPGPGRAALCF